MNRLTVPDNAWSPRVQPGWYAEWLLMIYGREIIIMENVWGPRDQAIKDYEALYA